MVLGWFGKGKNPPQKALQKAHKLVLQSRWAEALSYYEEAGAATELAAEARQGLRACRSKLVEWNLQEAASFHQAGEPERAREHAELALELAGEETDLRTRAQEFSKQFAVESHPTDDGGKPKGRLFEPSCASCSGSCTPAEEEISAAHGGEELFDFYLDSLGPAERTAFSDLSTAFRTGFVLLQQGETNAARPFLKQSAAEAPTRPGPAYALGLLAAVDGDDHEALEYFEQALHLDADFAPAVHHRADVLRETGHSQVAAGILADWCAGHPGDTEALYLLALCRREQGELAQAIETLDEARAVSETFQPRFELLRATIFQQQGDEEKALETLQGVAARNPDLIEALVPLGQLLLKRGGSSAERAAELFKHCRRIDPQRGWWHLLRVAEAYGKRGWQQEARELLHTARRELPDAPEAEAEWETVRKILG